METLQLEINQWQKIAETRMESLKTVTAKRDALKDHVRDVVKLGRCNTEKDFDIVRAAMGAVNEG